MADSRRSESERAAHEGGLVEHRVASRSFESAFTNAPIGMALVDMAGRWLQVNDALCRITGYAPEKLRATTLRKITHPEDVDLDADDLRQLLAGEITSYHVEKRYCHDWGHYIWVLLTVSLVRNDQDEPVYLISQVQDISVRRELEAHLGYLVDHDFLTGLINRRRFEEELRMHVERVARYGPTGALLLIDLDNFKDVNDSFGHKAGDDLLKGIAGLFRQRTRRTDVLARLGGDEFGLLLSRADAAQAATVAGELVNALHHHVAALGEQNVHISASIGVALFDGLSDIEMLAYADLAMYEAKESGRNRFSLYQPGGGRRERASARLVEAERIRRALEEDRFTLDCQPILDLARDEVCQYELLLRLQDDRGSEPLQPGAFLYSAERFGLIEAIDAWVVRQAVALIDEHTRAGRRLILDVNLSGKSIGDPELATVIEAMVAEASIDPSCLVFEVTETAAIANIEQAKSFAERLRGLGCQLALDDFGAGFGSFFYFKNLPFDFLKIDGEYIRNLATSPMDRLPAEATSPMDRLLVEALVSIARGMGKKTIAEFVAGDDVTRLLRTIGVDYAQGYHIGRPRPVTDVLALT
jgi:diguanylate cyclase (GGDEF)-like protein/PAS domain S-box-containing protein